MGRGRCDGHRSEVRELGRHLAAHYSCEGGDGGNADSCSSTQNALNTGKPLWDSEQGSQDDNTGAGPLIRAITRGYIDAKMTALLNWPLIAAMTPNLPYPTDGLAVANSPWSGAYSIGDNTWAIAQVTQFTQPGWQFLDGASGYLGGDRTNGSYVALKAPGADDYSLIAETTTATAPSTVSFTVSDGSAATKPVQVWATNLGSTLGAQHFVHLTNLTPNSAGQISYTLQPDYIYTFSTVKGAGRGHAAGPSAHHLALPYTDNFDSYAPGQEARYTEDMQGAFEAQPCATGHSGLCLQQMAPVKPIEWQQDSDAYTLVGDPAWTNYTVKTDVELAKTGTVERSDVRAPRTVRSPSSRATTSRSATLGPGRCSRATTTVTGPRWPTRRCPPSGSARGTSSPLVRRIDDHGVG